MVDKRLQNRLAGVMLRLQRVRLWKGFASGWLVSALAIGLLMGLAGLPLGGAIILGIVLAAGMALWISRPRESDLPEAARLVEQTWPELDSRLLAAIDLRRPEDEEYGYGYLQTHVLSGVLEHSHEQSWEQAVPRRRMLQAQGLQYAAFALFAVTILWLGRSGPTEVARKRPGIAPASTEAAAAEITVTPGDVEVERGTGLLVTARFNGPLPASVELVARDAEQRERRIALNKSLSDPVFGGRIPEVRSDLEYRIVYDGDESKSYTVKTFDFPRLERADADIKFPEYTGRKDESIPDVRRVSMVEGSQLTLTLELNKEVATAALQPAQNAGETTPLKPVADEATKMQITLSPEKTTTYRLLLEDAEGRNSKETAEIVVSVVKNLPPDLKIAFPSRDVRVSPLQEVLLEGTASDDFGLREHGLIYQMPDGMEKQLVLGSQQGANASVTMSHLLALEPLGVEPDNLVSYYFYAEDIGPDGKPRRAFSEMFFAEVRPFEEIYRQAPSQPPGQGEAMSSPKIVELQRQIVSASWNLLRQNPLDPPAKTFRDDTRTLDESQQQAIQLLKQIMARMDDPAMKHLAAEAEKHMQGAAAEFASASEKNSIDPLSEGRAKAQQAYQALLRLQAREYQVKNCTPSPGQGQQPPNQLNQQLKALELKNDRRRYETERQAQQEQNAQSQEALQVLNRLRELARRQEDLNERIRQLETALRNAQTDEEREEIDRQLKRLQEEQQNLLRDVDELRERMNREENRSRMNEERENLDRTRERIQQSAEALEQRQPSQALAEGTRAQRELEQLREDFRRKSAGQFDEAVRQLRNEVRELASQQEQLGRELRGESPQAGNETPRNERAPRPSLRSTPDPSSDHSGLAESFADQQQRLDNLMQQARSLVEESETAEPLLSQRLYEAIRQTRQDKPSEALAAASELLRRGFEQPAGEAEAQAREGINKFRAGVEQAAEGVLGDETAALRRAREELAMLTNAIGRELEENNPDFAEQQRRQQAAEVGQNGQDGEPQPQENKRSEGNSDRPGQEGQRRGQEGEQDPNRPNRNGQGREGQQGEPREESSGRPGEQPGQQPGQGRRPGEGQKPGQQPGQGQQPGEGQRPGQGRPGQGRPGQGRPGQGQQPGQQGQPSGQGQRPGSQPSSPQGQSPQGQGQSQQGQGRPAQNPQQGQASSSSGQGGRSSRRQTSDALESLTSGIQSVETNGGGNAGPVNPLTGSQFLNWSDRMREIEEMVGNDELRAEAATIRERARQMRIEFKRHSTQPNWELVRTNIYGPMRELERRIAEELARRSPEDRLVPIDREAVPDEFAELVKRYYEELSRDRPPVSPQPGF